VFFYSETKQVAHLHRSAPFRIQNNPEFFISSVFETNEFPRASERIPDVVIKILLTGLDSRLCGP
jgi:hypothetical protein